jgi:hypothetical protein
MLRSADMAMIEFRRMETEKLETPGSVRDALRSLFGRLGRTVAHDENDGSGEAVADIPPAVARLERRARALRANAHAAHDSVEAGGDRRSTRPSRSSKPTGARVAPSVTPMPRR